jgi:hypothetical protein
MKKALKQISAALLLVAALLSAGYLFGTGFNKAAHHKDLVALEYTARLEAAKSPRGDYAAGLLKLADEIKGKE